MLNKKVYFTSADDNGCGWYRTKLIADYFQQDHHWLFPAYKEEDGALTVKEPKVFENDVLLIQRQSHPFFIAALPWLQGQHGKKIVFDIDDNLWHIPSSNPAQKFYPKQELKNIEQIMKLCNYITVSTEPLKEFFLKHNFHDKIEVVPNMLADVYPRYKTKNAKLRIGYCGSPTHKGDFSHNLCSALREVKRKYDCELIFFGYNPIKTAENEYYPGCPVAEYLPTIKGLNLDIAIAPLVDDTFNRCKSNLKFLEYSACGFTTIASNVYPYANTIVDGETGLLVKNEKDWLKSLVSVIEDEKLRETLAWNAYNYVENNFTYRTSGHLIVSKWEKILGELF